MNRIYRLYYDETGIFVGIQDMTTGESYGAVFYITDTQEDPATKLQVPTEHVTRFNEWNAAQETPLVVPELGASSSSQGG